MIGTSDSCDSDDSPITDNDTFDGMMHHLIRRLFVSLLVHQEGAGVRFTQATHSREQGDCGEETTPS